MTDIPLSPIARQALTLARSRVGVTVPENDDIRPASLDEIIGQTEVVEALRKALAGAEARGELPEHMLLAGPAGTGKTTLALCVANAIGGRLRTLIGPSIKTTSQLTKPDAPLMTAQPRDVIFIDEIHRMWQPAQEFIFPIVEDGKMVMGSSGEVRILPPILFIGATTDPENLLTPMLDRFRVLRLRLYEPDELVTIVQRAAGKLDCTITDEAAQRVAGEAEGVPRVAIRIVKVARDYAQANKVLVRSDKNIPLGVGYSKLIDLPAVELVLSSTAYQWRTEGRDAG